MRPEAKREPPNAAQPTSLKRCWNGSVARPPSLVAQHPQLLQQFGRIAFEPYRLG
jgi:hypothetical protein